MARDRTDPSPKQAAKWRDDTRRTLVLAAIRLFAEKGYDATTTRDIVEAASLNISLISYYFGGKEGLLDACLAFVQEQLLEVAAPALVPAGDVAEFRQRLQQFVRVFIESHAANPLLHRLVQREQERNSPSFRRLLKTSYAQSFGKIVAFLAGAQARGWVDAAADPVTLAIAMHGAMVQQIRFAEFRRELEGPDLRDEQHRARVISDITALLSRGLLLV